VATDSGVLMKEFDMSKEQKQLKRPRLAWRAAAKLAGLEPPQTDANPSPLPAPAHECF
jgi:hypothetical protein